MKAILAKLSLLRTWILASLLLSRSSRRTGSSTSRSLIRFFLPLSFCFIVFLFFCFSFFLLFFYFKKNNNNNNNNSFNSLLILMGSFSGLFIHIIWLMPACCLQIMIIISIDSAFFFIWVSFYSLFTWGFFFQVNFGCNLTWLLLNLDSFMIL